MKTALKVGIDIGSTTIKLAVLDENNRPLLKKYDRHLSAIEQVLSQYLEELYAAVGDKTFTLAVTGSAGMGVATRLKLPFVQEVIACSRAVSQYIPQTDTAIEIGGEDAKITYFGKVMEQRMNGACAGGTGAFIDKMAALLSTDAQGLNKLAENGTTLHTIASRCGVFAQTDIQALMNDGISKADIALSIFQAVVNQTIGNLAQGRPFSGNVAFLGGPLYFLPALKERFVKTLNLKPENVVEAPDGCYFVALGAALCDEAEPYTAEKIREAAKTARETKQKPQTTALRLFENEQEHQEFLERHAQNKVVRGDLKNYHGTVYLGIDAGSTTAKLVLVGKDQELLYTDYGSNHGSPLNTVVEKLRALYKALPPDCTIGGALTTGYGEALIKAALHADYGDVETFAHLRAAEKFCPEVSFVMDIGGQDMKCFFVNDGNIGSITLNEACSAGCGSFIETFAKSLNLTPPEFAALAVTSEAPVDLGTRCTVFMNSRVKQAQKDGATVADISAGIAISVIKNALFKVMQLKDPKELGQHIVVQGGTFLNEAVLRAMEKILGLEVIRPDIAGLMGAYGAAILACEKGGSKSALLGSGELDNFSAVSKSYRCKKCGNNCMITMQRFPDGGRYYTGNRCEKGIGKQKAAAHALNLYDYKLKRLFDYYKPLENAPRGKIGIPRGLNLYEDYPFWFTLFTKLGYEVVLSDESSAVTFQKGLPTVPSESLCYPAKLMHGHVQDLIEKGLTKIFYPCLPYNMADDTNPSDNHFNCPIVSSYAENIRGNMDILREQNITFYQPFLPIATPKRLKSRFLKEMKAEKLGRKEVSQAVDEAYAELERYREDVRHEGERIIEEAERAGRPLIILAGRPYHIDPEINHGLAEMISSYDLPLVSEDAVYHKKVKFRQVGLVNQWSYHARLYHAAQYAVEHDNVTLIQLSSFGCGLDAITTDQVKSILTTHQRIYTMIKLDEVNNLGAARIRLRSLLAALQRHKTLPYQPIPFVDRPKFTMECRRTHTILAPQMAPIHFELIEHVLRKHGYQVVVPPMPGKSAIDTGLRYVNNDMCYPAIVVIGQLISALQSGKCDPDHTSIMLFQTCGACRATNYMAVLRRALKSAGFPQVPVFACHGLETDAFVMDRSAFVDAIKAGVYGDVLMNVKSRCLPYEIEKGSTEKLLRKWMDICKGELTSPSKRRYHTVIKGIVKDFDALPLNDKVRKPRVGVVGEILVKYHPVANNHLEDVLVAEGGEVVMPDFVDFFLYLGYDDINNYNLLDGKLKDKFLSLIFVRVLEHLRKPAVKALSRSKRFTPPSRIKDTAKFASRFVSLGNMAGEGWFLTGEMVKLLEHGVMNIVCLQPFGCLPNHITGKGVIHELRAAYETANIAAIDCDAGASEVNQLNRIKLMMAVAKEQAKKERAAQETPE